MKINLPSSLFRLITILISLILLTFKDFQYDKYDYAPNVNFVFG
jgi:hypothetical protein